MTDNNTEIDAGIDAGKDEAAVYRLSHIEWEVADGSASADFFRALFGWTFSRFSEHYWLAENTQINTAAVGLLEKPEPTLLARACPVFIEVPDIEACVDSALALGAELLEVAQQIPAYGAWAKIKEPGGNAVGLFQRAI